MSIFLSFAPIIAIILVFPILLWNADRALTQQTRHTLQAALSGATGSDRVRWTEAFLAYFNTWFGADVPAWKRLARSCALSTAFFFIAVVGIALNTMFDIGAEGYAYIAFFWLAFGIAVTWPRDYFLFAQIRYAATLLDSLSKLAIDVTPRSVRWAVTLLVKWITPVLVVALAAGLIVAFSWALRLLIDHVYEVSGLQERVVVGMDQIASMLPASGQASGRWLQHAKLAIYMLPIFALGFIVAFAWIWVFTTALARFVRWMVPRKSRPVDAPVPRPFRQLGLLALPVVVVTSPLIAAIFAVVGYAVLVVMAAAGVEFY
jgi:hypothetical protein